MISFLPSDLILKRLRPKRFWAPCGFAFHDDAIEQKGPRRYLKGSLLICLDGLIQLFANLTDRGVADGFAQDGEQSLAYFPCGVAKEKGQQDQTVDTEGPSSEAFEQDPGAKGSGAGNP
jgi:hypothetical protein